MNSFKSKINSNVWKSWMTFVFASSCWINSIWLLNNLCWFLIKWLMICFDFIACWHCIQMITRHFENTIKCWFMIWWEESKTMLREYRWMCKNKRRDDASLFAKWHVDKFYHICCFFILEKLMMMNKTML